MTTRTRPLSPHLQVYKPQITSVLSILHRMTGVALVAGTLVLVYWLAAAADGPAAYATAQGWIGSWLGYLLMIGWSGAFFYHLCNGIRHLVWDVGCGLTIDAATKSGWTVVFASAGLTVLAWVLALNFWG
ncbi:MAG: succinate dehydrogenase, cytochrome b556 subunit [Rhodospirillaceae bacterium]|nr:succinate dehydrogenase, cytochrome b556 subunit [Rhodospirillaceae bacterium]